MLPFDELEKRERFRQLNKATVVNIKSNYGKKLVTVSIVSTRQLRYTKGPLF